MNCELRIAKASAGAIPATDSPLPIEVFVHGALCVAYSGQCLTSEALGGRSANRGECAQACRMPYELISDGHKVELGGRNYLLSPQDLAGLDVLRELARAGVASSKSRAASSRRNTLRASRVFTGKRWRIYDLRFTIHEPPLHPRVNLKSKIENTKWRWPSVAAFPPAGLRALTTKNSSTPASEKARPLRRRSHPRHW